jgi:hypothetical protein
MPIDTWAKLINLPNAEYKAVIKAYPAAEYECGSDWTSEGSSTYSHACVEDEVYAVTDDGDELTEKASIAEVQSNAGSWYFDFYAQKLYVRATGSDDLSNSATTAVIMCFVVKQFSTDTMTFDGIPCRAIVRQNSLPSMDLTVDDIVEGIYKFNFGGFSMNNDGWFDTASYQYEWFNKKMLIYLGGEDLPDSEYIIYFVGLVSDLEISDADVMFSVKDIRVGTFANIPVDHYWKADYPNLSDDDDGKPIPIWYGSKWGITPVCIDTYDSANLKAKNYDDGTTTYTDESTEAHDTTEGDMTLMQADPEVDDAYYFGHTTNPFGKIHLLMKTQGSGTWEITWEYYNGSTWVDLDLYQKLDDGTDGFTQDFDEDEYLTVSWIRPSNWATVSVDGTTAYWVRARVSSFTSASVVPEATRCKLDDTRGSKWKLAGHEINAISKVRKGGTQIIGSVSTNLTDAEFTLTSVYFDTTRHSLRVAGQGKVISTGSIGYSVKGADIARDILEDYLDFLSADLSLPSFSDTNSVRTQALALYLDTEESSREVLQTIGRSIIAFFSPTDDGKLSFVAYEPDTPTGTLELFDPDYYDDWKVILDHKFVRQKIILYYDEHPTNQTFKKVEKVNTDVDSKYGIKKPLEIKTYLKLAAEVDNIAEGVRDMCSKPVTIVSTSIGMKGFSLFPTQKVKVTKSKAASSTGSFDAKVFRIRKVAKSTATERTHVVGMDDLQTLGESFCYNCFTCQTCVNQELACDQCYVCYNCFTTQAGCQTCDTCQLCYTTELGCVECDDCESCYDCEVSVGTCGTCEDCYGCELCVTCQTNVAYCESCQTCYGCDTCDTCQIAVTCGSCDSCQNCNACQVCNSTQDCTPCDVCDSCQAAVNCGSCDADCQDCVSCEKCYNTYNRCTLCQICNNCMESYECGSCQTCQSCVGCDTCYTSEGCAGCDVCDTCQLCVGCVGCESCDDCYTCELGN